MNRRIFPFIHTHSNAYIASYFELKGPTAYPGKWNVSSCAYSRPRSGSASLLVLRALLLPYDPVAASTARPARPDRMYCQLAHSLPVAGAGSQNSVGCETARAQPRWVILALSKPSCGGGPGPAGCWARRIDMHVGGSHICMSLFCPQAFMWAERSKHPFSSFRGPALRVVRGDRCIMYIDI